MVKSRKLLLLSGDIFFLYLSLLGSILIGFGKEFTWNIFIQHLWAFSIFYPVWLIVFYILGLYDLNSIPKSLTFYSKLIIGLVISAAIGITFFYLVPALEISPKINLAVNVILFGLFFWSWRKFFHNFFSVSFLKNIGIVGINPLSQNIAKYIIEQPSLGYKLQLFVNTAKQSLSSLFKTKIITADNELLSNLKKEKIDILIIAEDTYHNHLLAEKLYDCLSVKIDFLGLAQAYEYIVQKIPIDYINKTWFLENLKQGNKKIQDNFKRVIDIIMGITFLILFSPLFLLIALAIKAESKGPVFYQQKRTGRNKKPFILIKFRSMKKEAEKQKALWAKEDDPRITKVGNILRRAHLDELPQLINIIKGDISLVGPRPERPEFVTQLEKEIPHYSIRHIIKPGFTGWAQIKFHYARTLMDSHEKFQYDLYYLKNRSLLLDLVILLKTFNLFFRKE